MAGGLTEEVYRSYVIDMFIIFIRNIHKILLNLTHCTTLVLCESFFFIFQILNVRNCSDIHNVP